MKKLLILPLLIILLGGGCTHVWTVEDIKGMIERCEEQGYEAKKVIDSYDDTVKEVICIEK